MPAYWTPEDARPALGGDRHRHVCARGCGAYWVCASRDCGPCEWVCPSCEADELDAYINALATEQDTEQEKDHEGI